MVILLSTWSLLSLSLEPKKVTKESFPKSQPCSCFYLQASQEQLLVFHPAQLAISEAGVGDLILSESFLDA
jgi:hypothetical protein